VLAGMLLKSLLVGMTLVVCILKGERITCCNSPTASELSSKVGAF
jgi:hypothetical protein